MNVLVLSNESMSEKNEVRIARIPKRLRECIGVRIGDLVKLGNRSLDVRDNPDMSEAILVSSEIFKNLPEAKAVLPIAADKLTIGCDPEFVLTDSKGRLVPAETAFKQWEQLGSDVGLGELRPDPSDQPAELLRNIQRLILQIPKKTALAPLAHSYYQGYNVGFHIHVSMPHALLKYGPEQTGTFIRNMIKVFDYYIGIPAMLADPADQRRLGPSGYGKPGDFRITECTLEYRTPGGFHLRHPWYSRTLLEACYLLTQDILNRASLITKHWTQIESFCSFRDFGKAYGLPEHEDKIRQLLMSPNRKEARGELARIHKLTQGLYGYDKVSSIIDRFFSPTKVHSDNLLENWAANPRNS